MSRNKEAPDSHRLPRLLDDTEKKNYMQRFNQGIIKTEPTSQQMKNSMENWRIFHSGHKEVSSFWMKKVLKHADDVGVPYSQPPTCHFR